MRLEEVFSPFTVPQVTYVPRPKLEKIVHEALGHIGAELIVFGPTATGKTSLIRKALEREKITNYVEYLLPGTISEERLLHEIAVVLAKKVGTTNGIPSEQSVASLKDYILTLLSAQAMPIFLDDARRAHIAVLADLTKLFNQWSAIIRKSALTLIIAGIDIDVQSFLRARAPERPRFIAAQVNRFTDKELQQLIEAGSNALNITFSEPLKARIIRFSAGLPLACQYICYYVCLTAGIEVAQKGSRETLELGAFQPGIVQYAETLMPLFEGRYDTVRQLVGPRGIKATDILKSLIEIQDAADDELGFQAIPVPRIVEHLRSVYHEITEEAVTDLVGKMTLPDGGEIAAWLDDGRFNFQEPISRFLYKTRSMGPGAMDTSAMEFLNDAIIRALGGG